MGLSLVVGSIPSYTLGRMTLSFHHLVSTAKVCREDVHVIFKEAACMEEILRRGGDDRCHGRILASLFYEPSTRTRLSFEAAMHRLGGSVVSAEGIRFSSRYKGESIEDTIRVVSQYADCICMRHPEIGSAERAAAVSSIPFINAGDGPGDHPTQGLLDLYTIFRERGGIEGLHVAIVGDLLFGRTVHSVAQLIALYEDVRFTLISPPELKMPRKYLAVFTERGIPYVETEDLTAGLDADVLYMTRIQKERFEDLSEYERLKGAYTLTKKHLKGKRVTLMHPLPRVDEIATDVDALPNAAYFRQVRNGLLIRMALLSLLLAS